MKETKRQVQERFQHEIDRVGIYREECKRSAESEMAELLRLVEKYKRRMAEGFAVSYDMEEVARQATRTARMAAKYEVTHQLRDGMPDKA